MKRNRILTMVLLAAFAAVGLFAGQAQAQTKRAAKAKITMAQARAIASKRAAGKIESAELEKEHGKLIYSFDIRNAKGTITEVQVEAYTGKIVSVEEENAAAEAAEKKEEGMKAKKGKKP